MIIKKNLLKLLFIASNFLALNTNAEEPKKGGALIYLCGEENTTSIGTATLIERSSGEGIKQVDVNITITSGLTKGRHGVHIHEVAVCTPCGDAKGHFDPGPESNSNPDGNHPFHSGDLNNIDIDKNGIGILQTTTSRITLSAGPLSIFDENGSSFIIHTNEDTYCPEGVVKGCAGGARDACGIIHPINIDQ
ncbi:MAG: superoxide dismutase family protein [Methylococcaceae bacterium]|nr:superoxide dismutase family protein [Methylococcaceae bacterium]